jgi:phage/plasmid-like protein (TIGR03299 family)
MSKVIDLAKLATPKTPWQGVGESIEPNDRYDAAAIQRVAGLNWEVACEPLYLAGQSDPISQARAVIRQDTKALLGVVGPHWTPLQNSQLFDWFQPWLDTKMAQLETVGSLKGGARVWCLASANMGEEDVVGGDIVRQYILLSNGHDGGLAVRAGFTPIRVICQNTLIQAHRSADSKLIRLRHGKDVVANLGLIRDVMDIAKAEFRATIEQYRTLARKSINQDDLRKYIKTVFGFDGDKKETTRSANITDDVVRLSVQGKGSQIDGVQGTLWGAYNAVNEYLNYYRGHNPDTRLDSLWFGQSAKMNDSALTIALQMAG